jgi:hypothetical protein
MIQNLSSGPITSPTIVLLTFGPFPEKSLIRGIYVMVAPGSAATAVPVFLSAALTNQKLLTSAEFLLAVPNLMQGSAAVSALIGPNISPASTAMSYLSLNVKTSTAAFLTVAVLGGASAATVSVSLDADVPAMQA